MFVIMQSSELQIRRPRKTKAQKDEGQESKGILPAAWDPLSKLKLNGR